MLHRGVTIPKYAEEEEEEEEEEHLTWRVNNKQQPPNTPPTPTYTSSSNTTTYGGGYNYRNWRFYPNILKEGWKIIINYYHLYDNDPHYVHVMTLLKISLFLAVVLTISLVSEILTMEIVSMPTDIEKQSFWYEIKHPDLWEAQIFLSTYNCLIVNDCFIKSKVDNNTLSYDNALRAKYLQYHIFLSHYSSLLLSFHPFFQLSSSSSSSSSSSFSSPTISSSNNNPYYHHLIPPIYQSSSSRITDNGVNDDSDVDRFIRTAVHNLTSLYPPLPGHPPLPPFFSTHHNNNTSGDDDNGNMIKGRTSGGGGGEDNIKELMQQIQRLTFWLFHHFTSPLSSPSSSPPTTTTTNNNNNNDNNDDANRGDGGEGHHSSSSSSFSPSPHNNDDVINIKNKDIKEEEERKEGGKEEKEEEEEEEEEEEDLDQHVYIKLGEYLRSQYGNHDVMHIVDEYFNATLISRSSPSFPSSSSLLSSPHLILNRSSDIIPILRAIDHYLHRLHQSLLSTSFSSSASSSSSSSSSLPPITAVGNVLMTSQSINLIHEYYYHAAWNVSVSIIEIKQIVDMGKNILRRLSDNIPLLAWKFESNAIFDFGHLIFIYVLLCIYLWYQTEYIIPFGMDHHHPPHRIINDDISAINRGSGGGGGGYSDDGDHLPLPLPPPSPSLPHSSEDEVGGNIIGGGGEEGNENERVLRLRISRNWINEEGGGGEEEEKEEGYDNRYDTIERYPGLLRWRMKYFSPILAMTISFLLTTIILRYLRTISFSVTVLPNGVLHCKLRKYAESVTSSSGFWEKIYQIITSTNASHGGCNDLIFSGHVSLYFLASLYFHLYSPSHLLAWISYLMSLEPALDAILKSQHYSVDVFVAIYSTFLVNFVVLNHITPRIVGDNTMKMLSYLRNYYHPREPLLTRLRNEIRQLIQFIYIGGWYCYYFVNQFLMKRRNPKHL